MKIVFHGAAGQVGKSCIELRTGNRRYLLDSGVEFDGEETIYPTMVDRVADVDAVLLSHAHMDHSGALPLWEHRRLDCPVYMTPLSWRITEILLKDAYHVAELRGQKPPYKERDISRTARDVVEVSYDEPQTTRDGGLVFTYRNAGHIPGGACIVLEAEGKRVVYTGDINTEKSLLMVPSTLPAQTGGPVDALVIDTTYGDREHPDRAGEAARFRAAVAETVARGGSVLVPAFGVGRAQEILLMLADLPEDVPLLVDGMARAVSRLVADTDDPYVAGRGALADVLRRATMVTREMRGRVAAMRGAVIVATSGMMQGGPAVGYADAFAQVPENIIMLTGYQAQGTHGRRLRDDRVWERTREDGTTEDVPVSCGLMQFDFSAHYGQGAIKALIAAIPHKHLILQHGDERSLAAMAAWARAAGHSMQVHVPAPGDTIAI